MDLSRWSRSRDVGGVAIILVTVLALAIGEENIHISPLCGTEHCAKHDENFLYLWDESPNMCDRPYSTVCSHNVFEPENVFDWVDDKWDHYKSAEYAFHNREKGVLVTATSQSGGGLVRAKKFYDSCVSQKNDDQRVVDETVKIIKNNPIGAWPLLAASKTFSLNLKPENFSWQVLDKYYLEHTGESAFHDFSNTISSKNGKNVLIMKPPEFTIPKEILWKLEDNAECQESHLTEGGMRKNYSAYIMDTVSHFFSNITDRTKGKEEFCKIVDRMIAFEIALAKISMAEKEVRYPLDLETPPKFSQWKQWHEDQMLYHDYSFDHGVQWIESPILHFARSLSVEPDPLQIDWTKWMADLWQHIITEGHEISDRSINEALVQVPNKIYYVKLSILLRTTKLEVIVNYMHWKFLRDTMIRTRTGTEKFQKMATRLGFEKKLKKPRWLTCVEENVLKDVVHKELMKQDDAEKYLSQTKEVIRNMYDGIVMGLVDQQIQQEIYRWNTDSILENHANQMTINIFGDKSLLTDDLDSDLPDLPAPEVDDYLNEYRLQRKWRLKHVLKKLGTNSAGKIWPISPDRATIVVTSEPPQLFIPAAILQKPFFDFTQDKFRNYAGIGAEIATAIWQTGVLPARFPQQTYEFAKHCSPLKDKFNADNITESTELRIFKSGRQVVDAVQMALDAYAIECRYDDDNGLGYKLQHNEKQVFIAAYIATQCEYLNTYATSAQWDHSISGEQPAVDTVGLTGAGIYYPFKDDSTAKFRIDVIDHSAFYQEVFVCSDRVTDKRYC